MRKIFAFCLLVVSLSGYGQGNDTTKYFKPADYGLNYQRVKTRLAFIPPSDTVGNKLGLVVLNGVIYTGNGSYWTEISVNGKLNISDTGAMLAPRWLGNRIADSLAAIQSRIQSKQPLGSYLVAGNNLADVSNITTARSNIGLGNVPNVDATNATNISSGTLADVRLSGNVTLQGNSFNGANQLVKTGSDGKLLPGVIPALALVDTYTPASQAAMLALPAEQGDIAIRTDINVAYILYQAPASTLGNWIALPAPSSETDPVFTSHVAFGITATNISNWSTAYGWGNWAAGSHYIGTTLIANNRASASQILTGVSIDGNAATVTNGVYTTGSYPDPSWITSLNYSKLTGTIPTWNQNTTGTAAIATKWGNGSYTFNEANAGTITNLVVLDGGNSQYRLSANAAQVQTWLGLGSNAYTSTSFLPITAGSGQKLTGDLYINKANAAILLQGAGGGANDFLISQLVSTNNIYFTDNNTTTKGFILNISSGALTQLGTGAFTWNGSLTAGAISGTTGNFSSIITSTVGNNANVFLANGATTGYSYAQFSNTSGGLVYGIEGSVPGSIISGAAAYAASISSLGAKPLVFGTNQLVALTLSSGQDGTFAKDIYTSGDLRGLYFAGTRNAILGSNSADEVYIAAANATRLTVGGSGITSTVSVTATAFYETPSDIRKKNVLRRWKSADGIDQIEYYLKNDPDRKILYGYEAQQVMRVIPSAVITSKDPKMSDGVSYSVGYTQVSIYKIAQLEQRISKLEKQLKR